MYKVPVLHALRYVLKHVRTGVGQQGTNKILGKYNLNIFSGGGGAFLATVKFFLFKFARNLKRFFPEFKIEETISITTLFHFQVQVGIICIFTQFPLPIQYRTLSYYIFTIHIDPSPSRFPRYFVFLLPYSMHLVVNLTG